MTATIRSGSGVSMSGQNVVAGAGRASSHSAPDDRSDLIRPAGAVRSRTDALRHAAGGAGPAVAQPTATSPRPGACCAWPTPESATDSIITTNSTDVSATHS